MLAAAAGAADGGDGTGDGTGDGSGDNPPGALADNADATDNQDEQAAGRALKRLTGCNSAGEAIKAFESLRARVDTLDAERAALELSSRRELVADLVKLGVELPATAWEGEPEKRNPCKRLMNEPIDDLRKRVAALKKARPVKRLSRDIEPPESGEDVSEQVARLSAKELKWCKDNNVDPKDWVQQKKDAVRSA